MNAPRWGPATWIALFVAAGALVADVALLRRALAPVPAVAPALSPPPIGTVAIGALPLVEDTDVAPPDPFSPDRAAAALDDGAPEAPVPADSAAAPRLVGTVIVPGRVAVAVAFCQTPGQAPQTVHVGERCGGLTLVAVEPARAVFRRVDGTRLTLDIPKPGA